jgi:hypothetical protein
MSTNYFDGNDNDNGNTVARPRFSYDDILSGLNLQVSPNGVLQKMTIKHNTDEQSADDMQSYSNENHVYAYGDGSSSNYNSSHNSEPNNIKQPLDPTVKNSAIYNKYFKNYRDAETVVETRVPETWEEYHQMVREDHINRINARRRASQIKSTKMFYTASNNMQHFTKNYYMNPSHRMNGRNRLFKL